MELNTYILAHVRLNLSSVGLILSLSYVTCLDGSLLLCAISLGYPLYPNVI